MEKEENSGYYRKLKNLMDKAYATKDKLERDKIEKEIDKLIDDFFNDLRK